MFAILITEETLPKILEEPALREVDKTFLETCCNKDRYFVSGYVSDRGMPLPWRFFTGKQFRRKFEYDEDRVQTDWDQIVRKQPAPA